jgi:hypothetical protein
MIIKKHAVSLYERIALLVSSAPRCVVPNVALKDGWCARLLAGAQILLSFFPQNMVVRVVGLGYFFAAKYEEKKTQGEKTPLPPHTNAPLAASP